MQSRYQRQLELLELQQQKACPERKQELEHRRQKVMEEECALLQWPWPKPNERETFKLFFLSDSGSESESEAGGLDLTPANDSSGEKTQEPAVSTTPDNGCLDKSAVPTPVTTTTPENGCLDKSAVPTLGESSSEEDDQPWDEPVEDGGVHYIAHPINKGWVGQCLFVAMEHQLSLIADRKNMTYSELRRLAVRTQKAMECIPGVSRTSSQLKKMMRANTYGDNHEVAALSQALDVNVRLCQVRDQTVSWIQVTDHNPSLPTMRLMLLYKSQFSSANYMSMVPLD